MSTPHAGIQARHLAGADLAAALRDARARTWALVDDLDDAAWRPPHQPGVNPLHWEMAHIAWFAEFWTLRGPHGRGADGFATAARAGRFAATDAHFDSARLAHADRWTTPMPTRSALRQMHAGQLQASIDALPDTSGLTQAEADRALYFHRLALFHEDMHAEAFVWTRATLGHPAPQGLSPPLLSSTRAGRIEVPSGLHADGRSPDAPGFSFDNELHNFAENSRGHIPTDSYSIDSTQVSASRFAEFLSASGHPPPPRWRRQPGHSVANGWQIRWFDGWIDATPTLPAMHVSHTDALAYCAWAGCRLPTATEWEQAALRGQGFHWGHSVWEWTASVFLPYAGFVAGPYAEYSQPWFGDHIELRGGAFATHERMHHPCYRNFFLPQRSDIFSGFRTVAL
ncbi:MAG: ergothioneine biosynthesis protein EgtB [Pseudomonadota bacterium]|jgi:EgtB-related family protein